MLKQNQICRGTSWLAILLTLILSLLAPASGVAQQGHDSPIETAASCSTLTEVVAITYSTSTNEVIVIGLVNAGETSIDRDYLLDNSTVAIRSLLDPQPGVSLEPLIGDPDYHQMHYFPEGIRDTHFGKILAEADIALKVLSLGYDNETGQPININVPGYKSIPQRLVEKNWVLTQDVSWRLFITLKPQIWKTTDGRSDIGFQSDQVVEVAWAFESGSFQDPLVAAAVQEFIEHLNQNYAAFAAELSTNYNDSSLQETVELGKLVSMARWLQEQQIPISTSGGVLYEPLVEISPNLVPIIDVPVTTSFSGLEMSSSSAPSAIGPFRLYVEPKLGTTDDVSPAAVFLQGGVDFTPSITYLDDAGTYQQIVTEVRLARVGNESNWCGTAPSPTTTEPGLNASITYTAIAFPLSGSLGQISLPIVMKNYVPPLCPPAGSLANWIADNRTGGNLRAELIGDGSHVFPTGETCWSGIEPDTYSYKITSLGGPCQGAILTGVITFSPGETKSTEYTCN